MESVQGERPPLFLESLRVGLKISHDDPNFLFRGQVLGQTIAGFAIPGI